MCSYSMLYLCDSTCRSIICPILEVLVYISHLFIFQSALNIENRVVGPSF